MPVVKISQSTREDLQTIHKILVKHGTKTLPPQFKEVVDSMEEGVSFKGIVAVSVAFLKKLMLQLEEIQEGLEADSAP